MFAIKIARQCKKNLSAPEPVNLEDTKSTLSKTRNITSTTTLKAAMMSTNSSPQRAESHRESNTLERSSKIDTTRFQLHCNDASQEPLCHERPRRSRKVKRTKSFGIMHHRTKNPQENLAPNKKHASEPFTSTFVCKKEQEQPPEQQCTVLRQAC